MLHGMKSGLLAFAALVGLGAASSQAQHHGDREPQKTAVSQKVDNSVFGLFDRGILSLVAAKACKTADSGSLQSFAQDFGEVAELVGAELQEMNPGQRRDDLEMIIGFRVAQLELRAEKAIKENGCSAPNVQNMTRLFDLKAQLAQVELEDHSVHH